MGVPAAAAAPDTERPGTAEGRPPAGAALARCLFGPGHIGRTRWGAAACGEEWLTPPQAGAVHRYGTDVPGAGPGVAGTTGGGAGAVARQLIFRVGVTGNAGYARPATKSAIDFLRPV
ncbi:hypothetical protein GCM10010518_12610 [Kitasatospora cinereorecta]